MAAHRDLLNHADGGLFDVPLPHPGVLDDGPAPTTPHATVVGMDRADCAPPPAYLSADGGSIGFTNRCSDSSSGVERKF